MRRLALLLSLAPSIAHAQSTERCEGQTFAELAERAFGDAQLGPLVAIFNGQRAELRCQEGRFVRFPATIQHTLALGQTVRAVAERFLAAPGGEALLRARNGLAAGVEPAPGAILQVPSELEIKVGTRPEAELAQIPGLPDLAAIRRYNGVAPNRPLPRGGTILRAAVPRAVADPTSASASAGGRRRSRGGAAEPEANPGGRGRHAGGLQARHAPRADGGGLRVRPLPP